MRREGDWVGEWMEGGMDEWDGWMVSQAPSLPKFQHILKFLILTKKSIR